MPMIAISAASGDQEKIKDFEDWADSHGISLVGVNKNSIDLYYLGFDKKTDIVDWKAIPGVLIAADALYKIPENVIQVMDGKTIYFSTEYGRSYTVLGTFPEYDILVGLDRGIILERNYNPHTVIHELGHIVDYHGIKGMYNDEQNIFYDSLDERNIIFKTPEDESNPYTILKGYVSKYSTVNDAENFAENFAHYVIYPDEFREKINSDILLFEEYEFLRDKIFTNLEY